jgi:hypothetical protein
MGRDLTLNDWRMLMEKNSENPFESGDETALISILATDLPFPEDDNRIFSERGLSLLNALVPPLVEMRDRKGENLSIETIRTYLSYQKFIELAKRVREGEFSDRVKRTMAAYMASLGLSEDGEPARRQNGKPDSQRAMEQFHYATMYFRRAMGSV